jgi:hypothetical protein
VAAVDADADIHFHGVELRLRSDEPALLDVLRARFAALPLRVRGGAGAVLNFELHARDGKQQSPAPDAGMRSVYESENGDAWYDDGGDRLLVRYTGAGYAVCLPRERRALLSVDRSATNAAWIATRPLFTLTLAELLKREGMFFLHAAGVTTDAGGILLPGSSGSGKSTLAVALARAGFGFLGDDTVFLRRENGDLSVLPFPDQIDLSETSLDLLGSLSPRTIRLPGSPKWQFDPVHAGCAVIGEGVQPQALIFPFLGGTKARLEVLSGDDALLDLAPNLLMTERGATQRHLDVLADLVAAVPSYRLELGTDLTAAVAAVEQVAANEKRQDG